MSRHCDGSEVRRENLLLLNVLVQEFLKDILRIFFFITLKCHYLIHFARLMENDGPVEHIQYGLVIDTPADDLFTEAKADYLQCWSI